MAIHSMAGGGVLFVWGRGQRHMVALKRTSISSCGEGMTGGRVEGGMLTYVGGPGWHGSPPLCDKLVGVQADLDDVVEQSQQGRQRERRHEDGGEAKLEDCAQSERRSERDRERARGSEREMLG